MGHFAFILHTFFLFWVCGKPWQIPIGGWFIVELRFLRLNTAEVCPFGMVETRSYGDVG